MWAVLLGIPAVCIAVLVDRRSMWLDETTSMLVAGQDVAGMAQILRHVDAVFALYYGLLHVWLTVGTGTVHARMLSALFAIATLPVAYALARRLVGPQAAFLATLTLGTSYTFLRYAVETRPYSLEILLCATSAWCFVALLDAPHRRTFAAYGAATLLAIYAHPLAILWTLAQAASLAFVPRSRVLLRRLAVTAGCVAVGLLPLVAGVRLNGTHQVDWIPPMTAARLLEFFEVLAAGPGGGPFGHGELALVLAASAAAGALILVRSSRSRFALVLPTWLIVPIAAMLIISVWKPLDESRYVCYLVLPASLLIGVALDALRRTAGRTVAVAALIVVAAAGSAHMLLYRGEDWRATSAFLDRASGTDGIVVYTSNVARALQYAQTERGVSLRAVVLYPSVRPWTGDQAIEPVPLDLPNRAASAFPRLWVVLSHRNRTWEPVVLKPLRRFYEDVGVEHFGDVEVRELRLRGDLTAKIERSRRYGHGVAAQGRAE